MENKKTRTIAFEESDFVEALDKALNGESFKTEVTNTVIGLVADFILKKGPDKLYLNFRTYLSSSILKDHINTAMPNIRRAMAVLACFCDIDIVVCPSEIEEAKAEWLRGLKDEDPYLDLFEEQIEKASHF